MAVIGILADRKKQTVVDFFQSIPTRLKSTIQRICTDLYQGFIAAVEEEVPQAHIVVDRFHGARAYHGCADAVRKHDLKQLKQTLSKEEYSQIQGAMGLFRKSPAALNDEEQALLEQLFADSPKLKQAYIRRRS